MSLKTLANSLPKVLKVGPYPYAIEFAPDWIKVGDDKKWGTCDHSTHTIAVSNYSVMPNQEMLVGVVLHELLHAVWAVGNLPNRTKEETAVTVLETGLLQVFKDNPSFLDWIKKGLK
jgi:plastocyanin